jgi:hypothetical protein
VVEPSAGSVPPGTSRHIAINNQLPGRKREAATFGWLSLLKKSLQDAPGRARGFWPPCSWLTRVGAFSGSYLLSGLVTRSAVIWSTTRAERGETT